MINAELARHIVPSLSSLPSVLGATLGVERGNLVRMMMNERAEYVGRALNVACRLQNVAKERESHAANEENVHGRCYKAIVSAHLYNERLGQMNMPYKVDSTTSPLRNIMSGSAFACRKIDFMVDGAGNALSWPAREIHGWTCARSNWQSAP